MFHSHDHDHDHGHHPHEPDTAGSPGARRLRFGLRLVIALLIVVAAGFASSAVMVGAGQATVITRFGDLSRVLTVPGLAWKLPAPIESVIPVDLRLRTTSTGLQDVGTQDGLRILIQAYVAWQVPADPGRIRQFLRAVRNEPDEAARQIRSLVGSALQVTASSFEFADLVDTDPKRQLLPAFEARLRAQVEQPALEVYGLQIRQVGIDRLSLPETTLVATVAELRALSVRDSRITAAQARTEAADIEAASRQEAARIQARAYQADPGLYALLRSMDTLGSVVGPNTRMVLRTDAAPFNMLVQGPPGTGPALAPTDLTIGSAR